MHTMLEGLMVIKGPTLEAISPGSRETVALDPARGSAWRSCDAMGPASEIGASLMVLLLTTTS